MKPTIEQWQQYQAAFDYFNERLFEGQLSNCILNFSRQNQNRTRGYFSPERWHKDGEITHEINLSPRILTTDEPIRSLSTLVHEMVHLWQHSYGHPPKNCYHNKEWADKMESVGLIPSNTGEPGGKRTGMSCSHYVQEDGPYLRAFQEAPPEIVLPWKPTHETAHQKAPLSKVAYRCPACGIKAWGKPGLLLMCLTCNQPMDSTGQR
jgi:predicted SprT family Zn-dependent metalloprotease